VLGDALVRRGLDGLVSTNAIHLYPDLEETVASWRRVLRPEARLFVQSGNIGVRGRPRGEWIIDETVEAVARAAEEIVRRDRRFAPLREQLEDPAKAAARLELRRRYFPPVRPLDRYLRALRGAGFEVLEVVHRPVEARVDEWSEFLGVYAEGVLGWPDGPFDRRELLQEAVRDVFGVRRSFRACWTYVTARSA
jgi:SAM-dependent methyltransferase